MASDSVTANGAVAGDKDGMEAMFTAARKSSFLRINLDAILNNVHVLKSHCAKHTEVIAVIKGNAYGHGSVQLARHLEKNGISHFAVATAGEGDALRVGGVKSWIQTLGNATEEEISIMHRQRLTPCATRLEFVKAWAKHHNATSSSDPMPSVVIKVDTGMSRNGCQPEDLESLVQTCDDLGVPIHSVMTHFAQAWDDWDFSQQQLSTFLEVTKPLKERGVKLHAANSAAIVNRIATDLDFVRPGICLYGLPPAGSPETVAKIKTAGLRPALAWIAHPSLVKELEAGRCVGYDKTYQCKKKEVIATFSIGYADGYRRSLSGRGKLVTLTGAVCPVVGRVSMDAIMVRLESLAPVSTAFYLYSDDPDAPNSVAAVARLTDTIPYEVGTSLAVRMPRVYVSQGSIVNVTNLAS